MSSEIQAFLEQYVGVCSNCGHALKKIVTVHKTFDNGNGTHTMVYPSGLSLMNTHWQITEVDDDESTGTGCTDCEKGMMHAVMRNRINDPIGSYCEYS